MQMLLTVIATWLSVNFGLPEATIQPDVAFVSMQRMAEIRDERLESVGVVEAAAPLHLETATGLVFGMYDDATRTIYLPVGWDAASSADVSLLVHELVHHLQNEAGRTFSCAGEREKVAYRAQGAWLALFGSSLEGDFGLDPMTVLVRTNCFH